MLRYLQHTDPEAARRARARYACFDHFDRDSERYAYAAGFGASQSCEDDVIAQLAEMQRAAGSAIDESADDSSDEHFYAVMTHGYGDMYSYGNRVPAEDRRAIVAYIRALQLSQNATLADVPSDQRAELQQGR